MGSDPIKLPLIIHKNFINLFSYSHFDFFVKSVGGVAVNRAIAFLFGFDNTVFGNGCNGRIRGQVSD